MSDKNKQLPYVYYYGAKTILADPNGKADVKPGQIKLWCSCGLSKKQPWCDGSHKGIDFKPVKWKVPENQKMFSICNCKYTKVPPFTDAPKNLSPDF